MCRCVGQTVDRLGVKLSTVFGNKTPFSVGKTNIVVCATLYVGCRLLGRQLLFLGSSVVRLSELIVGGQSQSAALHRLQLGMGEVFSFSIIIN